MTEVSKQVSVLVGSVSGEESAEWTSFYLPQASVRISLPSPPSPEGVSEEAGVLTFHFKHLSHYICNKIAPSIRGILGQMQSSFTHSINMYLASATSHALC